MTDPEDVRKEIERRTDRVLAGLEERWGDHARREPVTVGPYDHDPDGPPASVADQWETMGGIASVVVWYTPERRETVLVYNPSGGWEPPGGRIEPDQTPEETARSEAREETGLAVEVTELLYTGRVTYLYENGFRATLPVAQFAGHRTDGHLQVEREGNTQPDVSRAHPGLSRATGLFDADTLPETRRDRELLVESINDPPAWDGE